MEWGLFLVGFGFLFGFGFCYDRGVAWLERHGYEEGYCALLVGVGSMVTLVGGILINWALLAWLQPALPWQSALVAFAGGLVAFATSGFWMLVGDVLRYAAKRAAAQRKWIDGALSDD